MSDKKKQSSGTGISTAIDVILEFFDVILKAGKSLVKIFIDKF